MHIRQSFSRGMQVVDDSTQQTAGILDEPLIDPDSGRIVGFFVLPMHLGESHLFLQSTDIVSWGTRVHVLSEDRLGPPEDFVRLTSSLNDPRGFLGQTIRISGTGRTLGVLDDVQFNTRHFTVEWLFPRRWLFVRQPIPVSDIVEVTEEAVWVKDPVRKQSAPLREEEPALDPVLLTEVATPGTPA